MNAVAPRIARAERIAPTFEAWTIGADGIHFPVKLTAETLAEAVEQATQICPDKGRFVVLETAPLAASRKLHIYALRKKAAKWRRNPVTGAEERYEPRFADPIVIMKVDTYVPVEHFTWSPGCDVVGFDRSVVEA